jgi:excisionase family DNA binding protein
MTERATGVHSVASDKSSPMQSASAKSAEAVILALAAVLERQSANQLRPAADRPLLDLEETAELLGVSRMTVARLADDGCLPSVVIRRGRVQKIRRIPRAFIDRILADACAGTEVDMAEYTQAWLDEQAGAGA